NGGGGFSTQTDLYNAISKPLRVNRNALVTFPEYDGATKWYVFRNSIHTRPSKMAAAKPVINIFQLINNIKQFSRGSVTHRNEISKATTTFSGSRNSRTLLWMLSRVSGSRKFKMATAKTSNIYTDSYTKCSQHSPASMAPRNKIPTAAPMLSGSWNSRILLRIVPDVTGSRFLKMAASKPEVVITQLLGKIATLFQRLTPHFLGLATHWHYCE